MKGKSMRVFDVEAFLSSAGTARKVLECRRKQRIFSQGDAANTVLYVQEGAVRLSVISAAGKEAVVGMMGPGDFFGEGCLAGQPLRMGSAIALVPTRLLVVEKKKMVRMLHEQHALADRFIEYVLARNIRIEEDLIDQLFNSSEKPPGTRAPADGALRHGRASAPHEGQRIAGDPGGDGRDDPPASELLHEQVPQARVHRIQRRYSHQRRPAQRRPARVAALPAYAQAL
jgi:CRP-like cAMP-binding protein